MLSYEKFRHVNLFLASRLLLPTDMASAKKVAHAQVERKFRSLENGLNNLGTIC
jgi:hypothetical protein